jgi:tRNA/tmRNA/rRNA uracil-C5-methylase (TrmA/RlmC/RlmD family)
MNPILEQPRSDFIEKVKPLCPVFGECGGCLYQDIPYARELELKEKKLKLLLSDSIKCEDGIFEPIVASPKPYRYRNRLDLKLQRTKGREIYIGFTPKDRRHGVVPIEDCPIAQDEIAQFIPTLKREAIEKLPNTYRLANLVVRTGDDQRVLWGGIGRRSLELQEEDYLWTEIQGRKIFYSLDTFFQTNLAILPRLFERLRTLDFWNPETCFYDCYGGVGLFGIGLIDKVKKVILVEESAASLKLAKYNVRYHHLQNFEIVPGKVEDGLAGLVELEQGLSSVALIDPPRAGLSKKAINLLTGTKKLNYILYLSCNMEALARDLSAFDKTGWQVNRVMPFDFFPKTKHVETLVLLKSDA